MLNTEEVKRFERDGFIFPLRVLEENEALEARRKFEDVEALIKDHRQLADVFRKAPNAVVPMIDRLARSEAVTDRIASLLGNNLLLYSCGLFVKEPHTKNFISWHQDLHYWGLEDSNEVTAWVALSPSTVESGCVKFVPGSHKSVVSHRDTQSPENMLSRGQEIEVDVNDADAVEVTLRPGEMSLHHGLVFHASNGNQSDDRRIGIAFRYIATSTRQEGGVKTPVTLVRGRDDFGHFELLAPPTGMFIAEEVDRARDAIQRKDQFRLRA